MIYYSNFVFYFKKKNERPFTDEEADNLVAEIKEFSGYEVDDYATDYLTKRLYVDMNNVNWYAWKHEVAQFMKKHPELSLDVERTGDDRDDNEKAFWPFDGEKFEDYSDVIISRPRPELKPIIVAIINTKDLSLNLITVPADVKDIEKWLIENYDNIDSNCTWQVVNKAKIFNTKLL